MEIVDFIRARLAEDEAAARRAGADNPVWEYDRERFEVYALGGWAIASRRPSGPLCDVDGEHIARHDPARVLREVEAKRRIVGAYVEAERMYEVMSDTGDDGKWDWLFKSEALEGVVHLLALPYSDHPDYDPGWALNG